MSQLETNLCRQFGMAGCLTGAQLNFDSIVCFEPTADFAPTAGSICADRLFDMDVLRYGEGVSSMGIYDRPLYGPHCGYESCFLFGVVVKKAGEKEHALPAQLAHLKPLYERVAADHYSRSRYPDTYVGGLMLRTLPLRARQGQIAEDWHVHKVLGPDYMTPDRVSALEIPRGLEDALEDLDPEMVANEYLISDCNGSYFQTAPASKALRVQDKVGAYQLEEGTELQPHRQLEDGELINGSSYVFHRAAAVAPENEGRTRTLVVMSYLPTKQTREAMWALEKR